MKVFITLFLLLSALHLSANNRLKESEYRFVKASIGKGKAYFLEVGSDSCDSCKVMGSMLYRVQKKHPEYNIHFINVKKNRDAAYSLNVRMIPTQIIYDSKGNEVYRHIGVLSGDALVDLFKTYKFDEE